MREGLTGPSRQRFFADALKLAVAAGCTALVVVVDTTGKPAIATSGSPEEDAVALFLERAHHHLRSETGTEALVLVDRPSGNRRDEVEFLAKCLVTMREGTSYVLPDRLTLVVATQSRLVRLLQLADVVVSSSLACVAGERQYSPAIFSAIRPMFRGGGGFCLKIHPDGRYVNLYHWLLGDDFHVPRGRYTELPDPRRPYARSQDEP